MKKNLDKALATLSTTANLGNFGFYNASVGENLNRVNTLVLCRNDVPSDVCRKCVNDSINRIRELCPNQNEAVEWYDECMLRYSNRFLLNNVETGPSWSYSNPNNSTDVPQFN